MKIVFIVGFSMVLVFFLATEVIKAKCTNFVDIPDQQQDLLMYFGISLILVKTSVFMMLFIHMHRYGY